MSMISHDVVPKEIGVVFVLKGEHRRFRPCNRISKFKRNLNIVLDIISSATSLKHHISDTTLSTYYILNTKHQVVLRCIAIIK